MKQSNPRIVCLCPTYKRPDLLRNAVACFYAQRYENKKLLVMDDAFQYYNHHSNTLRVHTTSERSDTLPLKYELMTNMVKDEADIYALWDDDDIYFPEHLDEIAETFRIALDFDRPADSPFEFFYKPYQVHSTYGCEFGDVITENCHAGFHGSWAVAADLFHRLDGYPKSDRCDFDQQMGTKLDPYLKRKPVTPGVRDFPQITYVYRWGNNVYHISQRGEEGYQSLWNEVGERPAPFQGTVYPFFDEWTKTIYKKHGFEKDLHLSLDGSGSA